MNYQPSNHLQTVKELMENAYHDKDGWFDARFERERYVKYLEGLVAIQRQHNEVLTAERNQFRNALRDMEGWATIEGND